MCGELARHKRTLTGHPAVSCYIRLLIWAMVGWVICTCTCTLPFFSFYFLKASVLCTAFSCRLHIYMDMFLMRD